MPYWDKSDLEARIGPEKVRQFLDDENTGEASEAAIVRLQRDADSFVEGFLRPMYDLEEVRLVRPNQVVRLSLDAAVMMLAQRHPEYIRKDWKEIRSALMQDLELIRRNVMRLDLETSPEPATVRR